MTNSIIDPSLKSNSPGFWASKSNNALQHGFCEAGADVAAGGTLAWNA